MTKIKKNNSGMITFRASPIEDAPLLKIDIQEIARKHKEKSGDEKSSRNIALSELIRKTVGRKI